MSLKKQSIEDISLIIDVVDSYLKSLLSKKLNISNVKHSLEFTILSKVYLERLIYHNGYYAKALYNIIKKKIQHRQAYKYYLNLLRKLEAKKLIKLEKRDGLLYIDVPANHIKAILYLIQKRQNSNSKAFKRFSKFLDELSPKPSEVKNLAKLEIKDVKLFTNENLEKKYFLEYSFLNYLGKIKEYKILLKKINEDKYLKLDYKVRFDNMFEYKNKIEDIINLAITKLNYKRAVLLTLTTDPKRFFNIYDAVKSFSKNLNKFFSFIRKKLGYRPNYLVVYEFSEKGLIHSHIVIFGIPYLLNVRVISAMWSKYGQGKIVDVRSLMAYYNKKKGIWTYKQSRGKGIGDLGGYLGKYLSKIGKSIFHMALFWVTNKRFLTFSRIFNKMLNEDNEDNKKIKRWEFIGCFENDVIEDIILYESNKIDYGVIISMYGGDYG